MRALKRIGIAIAVCMFACFLAIGFQVWFDLSTREDDVLTFTRLAMKNALVNIQTTEQEGYNFASSGRATTGYDSGAYRGYLTALLSALNTESDENMEAIKKFLEDNLNATDGDALFRPIQFGMTYVDKELFQESFETAVNDLVAANYDNANKYDAGGVSFTTKAPCALKINNCDFEIDGPNLGNIPTDHGAVDEIYKSIYGINTFEDTSSHLNLGFTSSAIKFYVYYDITVTVDWSSASANQLMTKNFFTNNLLGQVRTDLDFTPLENGSQSYLYIPGKPVTYSYRYVLTN